MEALTDILFALLMYGAFFTIGFIAGAIVGFRIFNC